MTKAEALEILDSAMNDAERDFKAHEVFDHAAYYARIAPVSSQILGEGFSE